MKNLIILLLFIVGLFVLYSFVKQEAKLTNVTLIKILKSERKMELYEKGVLVKTFKISLGLNPIGHKHFEGDNKTPEGKYFVDGKNPNSQYYKNLGVSYPNAKDKAYAKKMGKSPGGLIKIHGLKNGMGAVGKIHLLKDWTAGCIAITNEEMEELYNATKVRVPIEIVP